MDLQTLWFILIAVLFMGFFFLEGFDYGVGVLLPFVAKEDRERRVVINTIGPVWDGNEVWLLTAGGAMFAAFPNWYATLFSGFYLALFLILVSLIIRGVSLEFRSKDENPKWRALWDNAMFLGSFLSAFLWGVAVANLVRGVAIDATMTHTGTLFDLLNPYALLGGVMTLVLFTVHGALFLELKTDGIIRERVTALLNKLYIPAVVIVVLFVGLSLFETGMFKDLTLVRVVFIALAVVTLLTTAYMVFSKRYGRAFIASGLTLISLVGVVFSTLFPNVMISTTDPAFSLTIYTASSSQYTLQVMTVIALTLVPIVLAYQSWTYYIFRKRLTTDSKLEY